jgi:phosphoribosylanthranilate isomerase
MTNEERAVIIQREAEAFLVEADKKYNSKRGISNEQMTTELLGVVAGAIACMLASGMPYANVSAAVNAAMSDMFG